MVKPLVVVDDKDLRRAFKIIEDQLAARGRRKLFSRIARDLRDLTRRRITSQGGGTWKPLSKWTKARTGRRKALITLRKRIKAKWDNDSARVFFEVSSPEWDITDHHKGYTSRRVRGKRMTVPLKNPAAIGHNKSTITFSNRKASITPARKIWLSQKQTKTFVKRNLARYTREIEDKINAIP